jgi:hypothetical protein
MTDRAKEAITYLRCIADDWHVDGMDMAATAMSDHADAIESELRRCRAETLREAADHIETEYYMADDAARWMRRMAEEADDNE